jgi:hypothetical protein
MKKVMVLLAAIVLVLGAAVAAQAYVYLTPADYTGSRTTSTQIIATDGWADSALGFAQPGFKVAWDISFDAGDNEFNYKYVFSAKNDGELKTAINFLALRVSPEFCVEDVVPGDYHVAEIDVLGYEFAALYWDDLDSKLLTVEFESPNQPVWGSFLAYGSLIGDVPFYPTAWNAGIPFFMDDDGNVNCFIPVPDTRVPVPASVLLFGTGLLGLVPVWRLRRKA